jgi:hypothetical protein
MKSDPNKYWINRLKKEGLQPQSTITKYFNLIPREIDWKMEYETCGGERCYRISCTIDGRYIFYINPLIGNTIAGFLIILKRADIIK